jgi:hypothetical protein
LALPRLLLPTPVGASFICEFRELAERERSPGALVRSLLIPVLGGQAQARPGGAFAGRGAIPDRLEAPPRVAGWYRRESPATSDPEYRLGESLRPPVGTPEDWPVPVSPWEKNVHGANAPEIRFLQIEPSEGLVPREACDESPSREPGVCRKGEGAELSPGEESP